MQIEKEAAYEDAMNVVVIDDAGSEETMHTVGDQYSVDNEKFIDDLGRSRHYTKRVLYRQA